MTEYGLNVDYSSIFGFLIVGVEIRGRSLVLDWGNCRPLHCQVSNIRCHFKVGKDTEIGFQYGLAESAMAETKVSLLFSHLVIRWHCLICCSCVRCFNILDCYRPCSLRASFDF